MRIFLAALLAAFLAVPAAYAADRPVGPEAGQARTTEDSGGFDGEPESDPQGVVTLNATLPGGGWHRCDYWPWNRFCGGHRPGGM